MNKIVARFRDGRVLKGSTSNFVPTKDTFHVAQVGAEPGATSVLVQVKELKAIFFVKDFVGRPEYHPTNEFEGAPAAASRRIKVVFFDNEVLAGTTQGYQPGRPGFFMVPADQGTNIERCYVVAAATTEITLL